MKNTSQALGLLIAAAFLLGACAPAGGTLQAVSATQIATDTAAAPAPSQPAATSLPAQPTAASFKSKDPTSLTHLQFNSDPQTLDPASDYETTGGQIVQNTYDTLIFYNKGDANTFVPQLATEVPSQANGGISADGKTYTFKIRSGVKFHNGDLLTPDDAAFTFQRGLLQGGQYSAQWLLFQPILGATVTPDNDISELLDPTGAIFSNSDVAALKKSDPAKLMSVCQMVTSAIVADDAANTLTFHLAQSWGPFLATLANGWGSIQDKKWVGANGGWDGDCKTWQNFYAPSYAAENKLKLGSGENGTGPYMLDHWTPTQEVVLKSFDGYWRTTPAWPGGPTGAPRLKTIIIRTVPPFAARLAAFRAGEADFIDIGTAADWTPMEPLAGETCDNTGACVPAADPTQPLRSFKGLPSATRDDVFLNFKIDTTSGNDFIGSGKLDGEGIPPDFFSDVHVRKAFNYCFDWDAYVKGSLVGEGVQAVDVMLPGEIGYSDQDPHYSYDPARCQAEFQQSTLKSAEGRSLWDTGFRMTIVYNVGNKSRQAVAQILSKDISAVNAKFHIEVLGLPWPTYLSAQQARKLPIFVSGWLEDIHDPNDWLVPYVTGTYGGNQSLPPDLLQQLSGFINQGAVETDPAKRAAIYKQFNQAFYDAAPDILLAVVDGRHYEQRWMQGYYNNPIYSGYYFYALSKQ